MNPRSPIRLALCLLALIVLPRAIWSQQYRGYDFTTGVDSAKWIPLDAPTLLLPTASEASEPDVRWVSGSIPLDFSFWGLGELTQVVNVHKSGVLILSNSGYNEQLYPLPLPGMTIPYSYLMPYGARAYWDDDSSWVKCQTVGPEGARTAVFEFKMKKDPASTSYLHWQVQLKEYTCEMLFVYAPSSDSLPDPVGVIGWVESHGGRVFIDPLSHTAVANGAVSWDPLSWPGGWRWYSFVPHDIICLDLPRINVGANRFSAHVEWERFFCHDYFIVEYDTGGFAPGTGTRILTANSWLDIDGLQPGTDYEVRVRPVCRDHIGTQLTATFNTHCSTNLNFTNLYADNVLCRYGDWGHPSRYVGVIDFGSDSSCSRHTVHTDTNERDVRTNGMLRTIPKGHCNSVRLGNWMPGKEQEDINYTLQVDTGEYDLLLLRYAIVEQNSHRATEQPYFTFTIQDTAGNLIDQCGFANFVSGDTSGWNQLPYTPYTNIIVWHDWSVMGIDLAPYHGQTIVVQLSNYDCSQGGHWGYAYFTLEWGEKRIMSKNCGTAIANTYRAPQGFNYRWYNTASPSVTLSTADTLHVSVAGSYGCRVSYRLMNNDCGFNMYTRAGSRYPVARFVVSSLDSCGSLRRFVSRSVIATDEARTQLTNEPCEQFLWRFDDGTTATSECVTHRFSVGTHTVTLVAMLANGACRDSVSQTFTVDMPVDTIYTYICPGKTFPLGDILVDDSGTYEYSEGCRRHIVHISFYDTVNSTRYDTLCSGLEIVLGNNHYDTTGIYLARLTDIHGCDSMVHLHLTVVPPIADAIFYDTICQGSSLPYGDSIYANQGEYIIDTFAWYYGCPVTHVLNLTVRQPAVPQVEVRQDCHPRSHYVVTLTGPYHYTWNTLPRATCTVDTLADTLLQIKLAPRDPTQMFIHSDYYDRVSCPWNDTLDLLSSALFSLGLQVSPQFLTNDNLLLRATETGQGATERHWFIDHELQPDTGQMIQYTASPLADSVLIVVMGSNGICADTLSCTVPVRTDALYFPNVFAPNGENNTQFRAFGKDIENFELWIYDRRGLLVFHTTDMQEGWDGTSAGIRCRQETYAYSCRFTTATIPGWQTCVGTVTLLR